MKSELPILAPEVYVELFWTKSESGNLRTRSGCNRGRSVLCNKDANYPGLIDLYLKSTLKNIDAHCHQHHDL